MNPWYLILGFIVLWIVIYLVFAPKEKKEKKIEEPVKKISDLFPHSYIF